MATTETKFKKKRLFKVLRELNVKEERIVAFLEEEGYEDALKGKGLNASIVDEEAYLRLREEYADDAEAAERIRELRSKDEDTADQEAVASIEEEEEPEPPVAEAADEPSAKAEAPADTADEEPSEEPPADATSSAAVAAGDGAPADTSTEADAAPPEEASEASTPEPSAEATAETEAAPETEAPAPSDEADEPTADEAERTEAAPAAEEAPEATSEDAARAEAQEASDEPAAAADAEAASAPEASAADEAGASAAAAPEASDEKEATDATADATGDTEDAAAADDEASDSAGTPVTEATDATAADEATDEDTADEDAADEADVEATADADTEDDEAADEDEEDDATLKANRYRLKGTQVMGKVDLDQLRPRRKRKRKRKKSKQEEEDKKKKREKRKRKKKQQKQQKKKKRRSKRDNVDEEDVEQTIQETLQELEQGASRARQRRRRRRRRRHEEERERRRRERREEEQKLRVTEFVSTGELANLMGEPVNEVISTLFEAGMMVSINQRLDRETIEYIAAEYDLEVEFIDEFSQADIELREDNPEDLVGRAPVVTVMGHVDHGKTSLLDYIRNENVVAGEEGGITQHVGAHRVELPDMGADGDAAITFLDTPGHEAFTAMRARGAKATDIVILVIAADDAVMPQTVEAINHAQAADVPIVVAINKMDKREADPQRVMTELAEHNVLVEEFGGDVQVAKVSAETGEGVQDLLEKVLLQSELMELQANPNREASGVIIESRLEKGRGNVITVLVQNGTLKVGDPFVAGIYSGRVRAMFDERDHRIEEASPSHPALVLGCNGSPEVGDQFVAMQEEGEARDIAQERQRIHREQKLRRKSQMSLEQIGERVAAGEFNELNLIVKGDVGGSVEAISDALLKLKTDEVAVRIIHSGVGAITESDVMLARASDAVILGFQVRPTTGARTTADQEDVDIRTYSIIYDMIEDVHDALEGMLSPERREETNGRAEVRDIFKVPNVGTVAGCYVTDGRIHRNDKIRVIRDGVVVYDGTIGSLKRFQEDVREVQSGYECGMSVENFNDIKVGDELETYEIVEERRTLDV
ncbi:translation initiation factor IF-2 [Salisaeta longa]|uniref:translation initiation factor IF-2 n=1 Tax=Salisaeta longa TaxID=503170 RepID=UPI0003B318E0|nr:translation initiation factor IF-2 [Salisaeta longa]